MEPISAETTVRLLLAQHPYLAEVFRAHGLGKLVDPEARDSLAPFLTLKSALACGVRDRGSTSKRTTWLVSPSREPSR